MGADRHDVVRSGSASPVPVERSVPVRGVDWFTVLLFVASSIIIFVSFFEYERYQIALGPRGSMLSLWDRILLAWLVLAKSFFYLLPVLVVCGALILFRRPRAADGVLLASWILIVDFMASDLICVGFAGHHLSAYMPHIEDMILHPDQKIWQWAGEGLIKEALTILAIVAVSGIVWFCVVKWTVRLLVPGNQWLFRRDALTVFTLAFPLVTLGVLPALQFFHDRSALDRCGTTLPVTAGLQQLIDRFAGPVPTYAATTALVPVLKLGQTGTELVETLTGRGAIRKRGLVRLTTQDRVESDEGLSTVIDAEALRNALLPGGLRSLGLGCPRTSSPRDAGIAVQSTATPVRPGSQAVIDDPLAETIGAAFAELNIQSVLQSSVDPQPVDPSVVVKKPDPPNVILIIFESFRPSAVSPELMKELDAWSMKGLRLDRHFSGSNCSHLGLFSLFFGRAPLGYHNALNRKLRPQLLDSLRRSGYHITFLTSGETKGFRRVDEFFNEDTCHAVVSDGRFSLKGMDDWPKSDLWKLERTKGIVSGSAGRPQFVFYYLVSSHYRYAFPPEFEVFKEVPSFWQFVDPRGQRQNLMSRYANACLFLEQAVVKLLRSIDLGRNIVIVTGDHGESMGEDGVFTHATRMSESQLRVPFFMLGAGIEPRRISTATVHTDVVPTLLHALAGEHVPIRDCQGRDLMADPAPADQVLLVPANGPDWDGFMIVRGDKRLAFRTKPVAGSAPSVEFAGFVDEAGLFDFRTAPAALAQQGTPAGR
ncbi:MAG: sulfatase-like hydrolase/transferase [Desulfomonile sp.]|nr:sulfatase-like hydrolase/transferase [Desulfomonile sp.]